jgi:CheY-like chemotaxis protein
MQPEERSIAVTASAELPREFATDHYTEDHLSAVSPILLVEDNAADRLLIRESLRYHGVNPMLFVATDGDEAIRLLDQIEMSALPCPDLIILDVNLPKRSGFDVLGRLRRSPACSGVPVAVISSSQAASDKSQATSLGASIYITKPSNLDQFLAIGKELKQLMNS